MGGSGPKRKGSSSYFRGEPVVVGGRTLMVLWRVLGTSEAAWLGRMGSIVVVARIRGGSTLLGLGTDETERTMTFTFLRSTSTSDSQLPSIMAKVKKKPSVKPSPSSSPAPNQPPASAGSPSRPFLVAPVTRPAPFSVSSSQHQIKQEQYSTDTDEEDHYTSTTTLSRPSPGSFPRSLSSSTRPFPSSPSYSRSSAAQPSFTTAYIRPTPPRPSSRQSSAASPAPRAPPLATQVRQKSSFLGRLVWSLSKLLLLHFWWPILLVVIASVLGMKLWYGYERILNRLLASSCSSSFLTKPSD
jgi:hypothetical protein